MKKRYIIFDFDGTIANTNDIILESWQATFRNYLGHELPVRDIEATFGETLRHTISCLIPDAEIEEVVDYYRSYQEEHNAGKVYVFPGVRELMVELRARGCKVGIATSRTRHSLTNYMRDLGIEDCVDEIISVEDVSKHKPDPESVTAILEKFGAEPGAAIMIGDTKYDVGCAQNAGIDSVLVGWSHYVDMDSMAADGYAPTHQIATPSELLDLI